jgi:hypothetical protein
LEYLSIDLLQNDSKVVLNFLAYGEFFTDSESFYLSSESIMLISTWVLTLTSFVFLEGIRPD